MVGIFLVVLILKRPKINKVLNQRSSTIVKKELIDTWPIKKKGGKVQYEA